MNLIHRMIRKVLVNMQMGGFYSVENGKYKSFMKKTGLRYGVENQCRAGRLLHKVRPNNKKKGKQAQENDPDPGIQFKPEFGFSFGRHMLAGNNPVI